VRAIDFGGDEQQIVIPKSRLPVTKLELAELETEEEWERDECIKQGLLQQACVKHLLARARKSDGNELPRPSLFYTHTSLAAGGGGSRSAGGGGHAASASAVLHACGKARKSCGSIHS
jgi:hypothetical protein